MSHEASPDAADEGGTPVARTATVDAVEVQPHRAKLVQQTVRDLPVTVHTMDGRNPSFEYQFDRVLVDAPCSGLGALRRRPEARWRRQPGDVTVLAELQRELLASALRAVRRGGVVTYVTCSPHALETTLVVRDVTRLLEREGLRVPGIRPSTVAVGEARLRITLCATHTAADVDRLLAALETAAADMERAAA